MAVNDYTTIQKVEIDKFIEVALEGNSYIESAPIEHYSVEEIKEISEKAKKNNLVMTINEERSNFYQGVLINLLKREDVKKCTKYI